MNERKTEKLVRKLLSQQGYDVDSKKIEKIKESRILGIEYQDDIYALAITVSLGGTYLLSAFVQPEMFYTAQNIKVLRPKEKMSFKEKAYYCLCIRNNRFRYSSHGREANRSLDDLLVPDIAHIPQWVFDLDSGQKALLKSDYTYSDVPPYKTYSEQLTELENLFEVINGISSSDLKKCKSKINNNYVPFVRPSKSQQTSFVEWVDKSLIEDKHIYPRHTLYVSTNGQGSHTFSYVSNFEFVPNSDVSVLIPKKTLTLQEKLFYAHAITINRRLYSYGRKPKGNRLKNLKLPLFPPSFVYGQNLFEKATGLYGAVEYDCSFS